MLTVIIIPFKLFLVTVQLLHRKTLSPTTAKLQLSKFLDIEGTFEKTLL